MSKEVTVNRNYKDTVFRMVFSDRRNLLSLYNAVAESSHQNPEELKIVTLQNAVYMGMKNDIAFVLDTGLYLYEHQSTRNPNMPLRDLFYIASEYQVLVDDKSLYSSVLQRLPAPKFIVFYNGREQQKDVEYLKLSDAYESRPEGPDLELKVTVYNINAGHNRKLMEQCRILGEYASYVEKVRRYAAELPLNEAVEKAVTECIREGVLEEFLSKNRAEVIRVSIFEYDKEKEERKLRKAEYEAGWQDGQSEGISQGVAQGANGIIAIGRKCNLTDAEIIRQLQASLQCSEAEAVEYLKKSPASK